MLLYCIIIGLMFFTLTFSIAYQPDEIVFSNGLVARKKRDSDLEKLIFGTILLGLWTLTAFRGESIGNDTVTYKNYYEQIRIGGINSEFAIELGFQYFCLFLSKISTNPQTLLIASSTICYGFCGAYIIRFSNNILYSSVLLFCVAFSFFMSGIRQAIAMSILLSAYGKIKQGKIIAPIFIILIASAFHKASLVTLLWLFYKYIPKKPIAVLPIAAVIALLSLSGSFNNFLSIILKEYSGYFDSQYVGSGFLGISYYSLRNLVFYLLIYYANTGWKKKNQLAVANAALLLFVVCFGFSVNLFERASLYFLLATVADIPNAFYSEKIENRDLWMLILGYGMIVFFVLVIIMRPEWNHVYPYEFCHYKTVE